MSELSFNFENGTDVPVDPQPLETAAGIICSAELPGGVCEIGLLICSDQEIRRYNQLYRGDDSVTDVLCFNGSEGLPGEVSPERKTLICDILIDIKQVERQKGSKSLDKELMEIFIHGLLHGFGYDHIRAGDCEDMKDKENYYTKMMEGTRTSG
ncbi:MAG: rRNA maturation RNase YbeY [Candidatus Cloacimonetes bacterium]|nr:rRNA maturation RNase YbeY [Candidatus Cloacimonadota bacterium]